MVLLERLSPWVGFLDEMPEWLRSTGRKDTQRAEMQETWFLVCGDKLSLFNSLNVWVYDDI